MNVKNNVNKNDVYSNIKADVLKFAIETAKKTNKRFILFQADLFYKKYA
jgi:hypothetical protein